MPHSTVRHQFERDVLQFLSGFAVRLSGDAAHGVLVLLSREGQVMNIEVGLDPGSVPLERIERIRTRAPGWLLYNPVDFPEHGAIEWGRVSQATLERLAGHAFRLDDLDPERSPSGLPRFPESWQFVF